MAMKLRYLLDKLLEYLAISKAEISNYYSVWMWKRGKIGSSEAYTKGDEYFINPSEEEMMNYMKHAIMAAKLYDTNKINGAWKKNIRKNLFRRGEECGKVDNQLLYVSTHPIWIGGAA